MGCHTWFYVHIPEKKEEWTKLYLDALKKRANELYQSFLAQEQKEWEEEFNDLIEENPNKDYWRNLSEEERKKLLASGERKCDIDRCVELFSCNTWEDYKRYILNDTQRDIEELKNMNSFKDLISPKSRRVRKEYECSVPFEIKHSKIYVESGSYYINETDYPELVQEIDTIHDVFRISKYEAKPCKSVEDCEKTCQRYNKRPLTEQERDRLEKHFAKYPD